ncbi:MAG: A/G-specific adenine glycosylase [SAR86 cluster bacterium]|uniref:Adenine DNA glycosylase n=1 Tax=SAR86 cluster bacterium TaxID=2030880 RepID=A0A2A5CIV7_9GAMM|nr:MAG: A/G-specific adenine glycosylase [SAR86 cluster bacterium]
MPLSNNSKQVNFSEAVLNWFQDHGRKNLPWQLNPNPYRVWVSEIMLQQTQVATVIPYYENFMQSFPEVKKLALADEDKVLHHWTGLGYYARARNLHKTAKLIYDKSQGVFPDTLEELVDLPGIGRSTAGAILALADDKHAVILDGNVKRVLCRYHCVEGWSGQSSTQKQLWELATKHTPVNNCRSYTQAMMDLGATLCTRSKPSCSTCPLQHACQAHLSQRTSEFPHKKPRKKLPVKVTQMLILQSKNGTKVLLEKRPPHGIWGSLWSFPEIQVNTSISNFLQNYGFIAQDEIISWNSMRHTFSHFHLDIKPQVLRLEKEPAMLMEKHDWHWYDLKSPKQLGLAAPVKALLKKLGNQS